MYPQPSFRRFFTKGSFLLQFPVMFKKMLLGIVILMFLTSCYSPKKLDKYIGAHYEDNFSPKIKSPKSFITIKTTDNITDGDNISITTKEKSSMLPLLFYFQWHYSHVSNLNQSIPLNNFSTSVLNYANSQGLKTKLNGKTVELTVESVPHIFSFEDKGWIAWVIVAHFGVDKLYFAPDKKDLVVKYRVLQGTTEVKTGVITVPNSDKVYNDKFFQTLKKMTDKYLDQYDASINQLGKDFVDKLMVELQ
jgi:hypothetical protein